MKESSIPKCQNWKEEKSFLLAIIMQEVLNCSLMVQRKENFVCPYDDLNKLILRWREKNCYFVFECFTMFFRCGEGDGGAGSGR